MRKNFYFDVQLLYAAMLIDNLFKLNNACQKQGFYVSVHRF